MKPSESLHFDSFRFDAWLGRLTRPACDFRCFSFGRHMIEVGHVQVGIARICSRIVVPEETWS